MSEQAVKQYIPLNVGCDRWPGPFWWVLMYNSLPFFGGIVVYHMTVQEGTTTMITVHMVGANQHIKINSVGTGTEVRRQQGWRISVPYLQPNTGQYVHPRIACK